jgi:ankyrin repeat protein
MAPIHTAITLGWIACLILLLDNGVDADLPTATDSGITPVALCCLAGHVKCLALLVDRGANPDLATKGGLTLIHTACANRQYKCLQLLIARGADLNAKDAGGWTPLDAAKRNGHQECVKLLLEKGAVGKSDVALLTKTETQKVPRCYSLFIHFPENFFVLYYLRDSLYHLLFYCRITTLNKRKYSRLHTRMPSGATIHHATRAQRTRTWSV